MYKFLLVSCLFFITQKVFCPDEGYFIVLVQRYGPHDQVRARIDMPESCKSDVIDVLQRYFSYSRGDSHPFVTALKTARQNHFRALQQDLPNRIAETQGVIRASSDHTVPFKVLYGFNSGEEASAHARGKQIVPSEIKLF